MTESLAGHCLDLARVHRAHHNTRLRNPLRAGDRVMVHTEAGIFVLQAVKDDEVEVLTLQLVLGILEFVVCLIAFVVLYFTGNLGWMGIGA